MRKDQNWLALDLELNLDSNGVPKKIIQIGIAIGNIDNGIKTYSWYIDPEEPIVPYITELTGITDDDVKNRSTPLEKVAEELGELIKEKNVFVNPIQWGMGDAMQLKEAFRQKNIDFPYFGHREIDVKTIFSYLRFSAGKDAKGGLRSCMGTYKLSFEGLPHRADVDAYNTLRLFFVLMKRQNKLEDLVKLSKNID